MNTIKLSPSKVDCYFGCKRLYKYRYVVPPPVEITKGGALELGNVVHIALELIHKFQQPAGAAYKAAFIRDRVREKGILDTDALLRGRQMIQNYVSFYKPRMAGYEILSLEKYLNLKMPGISIGAKADRVDRRIGGICVVDYKSSRVAMTKAEILESVQMGTYGAVAKIDYPDTPIFGEYVFVNCLTKNGAGIRTIEITDDIIECTEQKYLQVAKETQQSTIKFPRNIAYKFCGYCEYSEYCSNDLED